MPKSTQNLEDKIRLARTIAWQRNLDGFTDEALKGILASVNQAQNEIMAELESRAKSSLFVPKTWDEERAISLLDELGSMTDGIKAHLADSIASVAGHAGSASLDNWSNVVSWDGRVLPFNYLALTADQVRQLAVDTPVGGKLLKGWMDRAIDYPLQEQIRSEIMTGMLKGEGYPDLLDRIAQGWDGARHEAVTLTRTYVQSANVGAMQAVYKANDDIVKGVRWCATLELGGPKGGGTCIECAALDGNVYLNGEQVPECPLHPRCRCVLLPVTKTWRELGFNVDEMEQAYRPWTTSEDIVDVGRAGKVQMMGFHQGSFADLFPKLTEQQQLAMVGPGRLSLLEGGIPDIKWDSVSSLSEGKKEFLSLFKGPFHKGGFDFQNVEQINLFGNEMARIKQILPDSIWQNEDFKLSYFKIYNDKEWIDTGRSLGINGYYNPAWGMGFRADFRYANIGEEVLVDHKNLHIGKGTVGDSILSDFRHEFGHFIKEEGITGADRIAWYDLYGSRSQKYWIKAVSEYGATNPDELFAESFAAYIHPSYDLTKKKLPKEIEEFFDNLFKKEAKLKITFQDLVDPATGRLRLLDKVDGKVVGLKGLGAESGVGGLDGMAGEAKAVGTEWKPTMTRTEAEKFIEGSKYTKDVFHVTPMDNTDSLLESGFNLERVNFGRMWGNGVYVAMDQSTVNLYDGLDAITDTLTLKVKVENPFTISSNQEMEKILKDWKIADLAFKERVGQGEALAMKLREQGYDSLILKGSKGYGGNQIVIWDPKKVVFVE